MSTSPHSTSTRYRQLGVLGQGAMGSVELVFDEVLGRAVARKRIRRSSPDDRLRFKREFRVLEGLSHPNLVRLHELGEDAAGLYFTMDAVEGMSLDRFCACRDERDAMRCVLPQIIGALGFLHSRGVVHRDLKPSNVMVTPSGEVKVLDFGLLARLDAPDEPDDARAAGTPGYMPPEQIRGGPLTPASDIYALGCIVFELVAGRPVFEGARAEVLQAHLERTAPDLLELAPQTDPALASACAAMLAKAAEARPTVDDLQRMLLEPLGARAHPQATAAALGDGLVGRRDLQERLLCWAGSETASRILVLHGPTGVGKTALVEWLLRQESARAARHMLKAQSRPNERVAFNAMDAAIDQLSRLLARSDTTPAVREAARTASAAFPVLLHGQTKAERVREEVRARLFRSGPERQSASRAIVFDAVATLVGSLCKGSEPLLLASDDFQWADLDSVALLDHCLDRLGAKLRVLLALRDDVEEGPAEAWLRSRSDSRASSGTTALAERCAADLAALGCARGRLHRRARAGGGRTGQRRAAVSGPSSRPGPRRGRAGAGRPGRAHESRRRHAREGPAPARPAHGG